MKPVILHLENIGKTFRDQNSSCQAVADVSFSVFSEEVLCIMGPSGCGKSTLLRIIGNLEQADTGLITGGPGGVPHSAMVFQDASLFPWLSVSGNIRYGLSLKAGKIPSDTADARVAALLSLTHLEPFSHSFPYQLSGGMKQRVAVARALAVEPEVLLMDEPFSALDPFTRRELQDEIVRIRNETRTTILLVTHNPEEAAYLADRVIVLSQRPAVVSEVIPVTLPRPRDVADPAFITVREKITRAVRGLPGTGA